MLKHILKVIFSASFIGWSGVVASTGCIAAALAFSTIWAPLLTWEVLPRDRGVLLPLITKILLFYCAAVLLLFSVITINLFGIRQRLAKNSKGGSLNELAKYTQPVINKKGVTRPQKGDSWNPTHAKLSCSMKKN
jgi:hypothetical protein